MASSDFEEAYRELEEGKLESALEKFLKIAEKDQSVEVWVNIGNIYRRMNLLAKAIESYKRALEIDQKIQSFSSIWEAHTIRWGNFSRL